ncbi:MAG: hypothetical protein R6U92_00045 [Bacillota bacterium]
MERNWQRIEYRRGMLADDAKSEDLPADVWVSPDIPKEVLEALERENVLELRGCYGDPDLADPVQYDHLVVTTSKDAAEILVFNRAVMLFVANDERLRRIHRIMVSLDLAARDDGTDEK